LEITHLGTKNASEANEMAKVNKAAALGNTIFGGGTLYSISGYIK